MIRLLWAVYVIRSFSYREGIFDEYAVRGIRSDVKRVGDGTW